MILLMVFNLSIIIAANIYIPRRLGWLFGLKSKKPFYITVVAGTISFFITMGFLKSTSNGLFGLYYLVSSSFLGFLLFTLLLLLCFEIINLIIKLPRKLSGITILGLAFLITVCSIWNSRHYEISRIDIPVNSLQNELNIMHLSDIHLGFQRGADYLEDIVNETNALNPDLVLITGDIIDSKGDESINLLAPLSRLEAPAYFTYGNHDFYAGLDRVLEALEENKVKVLRNEVVITNGIQLVGLEYMNTDTLTYDIHQVNDKTISEVLPTLNLSAELPAVVMQHGPVGADYLAQNGIDCVIVGHTHAGQVFPATIIAEYVFPYNIGLHKYENTYIYVSQGAGTFVLPMRLGTFNEITLIRLTKN